MEKIKPLLKRFVKILHLACLIIVAVTVLGIAYGFIVERSFTLEYAFFANFIVAALIIAVGFLLPAAPDRFVNKLRSRQLVEYTMHKDYMESRQRKQKEGHRIMAVGIAAGVITGLLEALVWVLM